MTLMVKDGRASSGYSPAHPRQVLILDAITHRPGQTFRGLARNTGIPFGTLRHHLNKLLRSRLVYETRNGVRCLHFPGTVPADPQAALRIEADALRGNHRRVLDATEDGDIQKTIIARVPGVHRNTVRMNLLSLERRGFLRSHRSGKCLIYTRIV